MTPDLHDQMTTEIKKTDAKALCSSAGGSGHSAHQTIRSIPPHGQSSEVISNSRGNWQSVQQQISGQLERIDRSSELRAGVCDFGIDLFTVVYCT